MSEEHELRPSVVKLLELGPLPPSVGEDLPEQQFLDAFGNAVDSIESPVSVAEAQALMTLFGPDDCLGLAWSLIHLIETASESPLRAEPDEAANENVRILWMRQQNAG